MVWWRMWRRRGTPPERGRGAGRYGAVVQVDLLFDPFGGRWPDVRDAAVAAEQAGFDGVWLYDHLAGSVHGAASVLECWTTLTALAVAVPRLRVGPLVLNVANRDPGTLAVMAATLQHVSAGRLLLGLGAGGGNDTPYASEQLAFGRPVPGAAGRRAAVEAAIGQLRAVWTGKHGGVDGFLRPEPPPPVIIGGFGPKMAELAGRLADGFNTPSGPATAGLIALARQACERRGGDPAAFVVTVSGRPSARERDQLRALGVDRMIVGIGPPYTPGVQRAQDAVLGS
jgi:alkanesulfonate monooxygenase SsuD/methylene tetrahydromethanopterin reductase-like flavin-dependent oxidoreductase (luciferase family)